jgi:hypothetical protein
MTARSGSLPTHERAVERGWVVWKFELRPWTLVLDVPRDAIVLSAGVQGDDIVAWAICDPKAPKIPRLIAAHPTGVPLPPALVGTRFVATVQMADGLVFHVWDGGEEGVAGS